MTSYQRAGLYVFFDALEADFVSQIRYIIGNEAETFLTSDERAKCVRVLSKRNDGIYNLSDEFDLIYGLDLGKKYAVLMRLKDYMPSAYKQYFTKICRQIEKAIPIRNSTMHGRPLTAEEYVYGFALANDFCRNPAYWPHLSKTFREFNTHPNIFMTRSIRFLDDEYAAETLNNLPVPDYDDTGFVRRPALEAELKKKILGRYPVITVLGDGGNGKTALALQTAYSLLGSRDHTFEVIIWVSAKSNCLTNKEIERIENAITTSIGVFENFADLFEPGDHDPMTRVKTLLKENKVLLFIDNLETVLDGRMLEFASDVPGESKVIFTSRVPLQGGDLPVKVEEFTDVEARHFRTRLASAYSIDHLKKASQESMSIACIESRFF